MTLQKSDVVIFDGRNHLIASFVDGEPFVPTDYDFRPVSSSTACRRGYLCVYEVRDDLLVLDAFHVNHQEGRVPASQLKRPPSLNGVEARESTMPDVGRWMFERIGLRLRYTGRVRIGREPYRESHRELRFPSPTKFVKVLELTFEDGMLTAAQDLSENVSVDEYLHAPTPWSR
jgi:hypothetical protein